MSRNRRESAPCTDVSCQLCPEIKLRREDSLGCYPRGINAVSGLTAPRAGELADRKKERRLPHHRGSQEMRSWPCNHFEVVLCE